MDSKINKADDEVQKLISRKRLKSVEDRRVASEIFDKLTLESLYKLANQGHIDILNGAISTGKEANVLKGIKDDESPIAVKIYRIATSDFKKMNYYIDGDPRFNVRTKNKRQVIYAWVNKEYRNLKRLAEANVNVPEPVTTLNNILLLEFIGDKFGNASPTAKVKPPKDPESFYQKLIKEIKKFVNDGKLIHGDLSNFNILNKNETPVIIDVSQSVVLDHPLARELLKRDIETIVKEYKKLGVKTSYEELNEYIDFKR
ncbi:serine protein kinase RIO [Methanobrevibacter sp. DSM 116169]|uniref:serine protein kinase RIO n=1 Tax=Methanobrevibacter sp. DSM 116169 TaxID=3242727 RepID=UPI0038FC54E5